MDKLKIIFCTDGIFPFTVGGIQRHSRLLIEELAKNTQLEITVVHPHSDKRIFKKILNVKEIAISDIDTKKNYLLECYRYSKRVYEKIKNEDADIYYSQGISIWYKINLFKNKLIINAHGLEPFQAISFKDKLIAIPFKILLKYLFNKAKYVVSEGGHLTTILNKIIHKNKIIYLPNAANIPDKNFEIKKEYNKTKLNLLFVGRFAGNKGIHILMQAIKMLNEEGFEDKIFFYLAGEGPLFKYFKNNYIFKNVKYLGFVSDEQLSEFYVSSDAFILPTLFEGMPTVILEAMSYHLPIIVTDVGATKTMVDKNNGFVIERDNPLALKKAIQGFYQLTIQDKKNMSEQSFERLKNNFLWKIIADKHIELFNRMIKIK